MKISPVMSQICQSQLSILPNKKWTVKNSPKTGKLLPKWRNFAKSGHTQVASFSESGINVPFWLTLVYATQFVVHIEILSLVGLSFLTSHGIFKLHEVKFWQAT